MGLKRITAAEAIAGGDRFDAVIDARRQANLPKTGCRAPSTGRCSTTSERRLVGTEYKQVSPFDARKVGAALAARNIARHVETVWHARANGGRWSIAGAAASVGGAGLVLGQIGFHACSSKAATVSSAARAGRPGNAAGLALARDLRPHRSGKSRLLQALAPREPGARPRGAGLPPRLGARPLPGQPQPRRSASRRCLAGAAELRPGAPGVRRKREPHHRPLHVPEALLQLRAPGTACRWRCAGGARATLLEDYAHFARDIDGFCERLDGLREVRGRAAVAPGSRGPRRPLGRGVRRVDAPALRPDL